MKSLLSIIWLTFSCMAYVTAEDGKVLLKTEIPAPLFTANGRWPIQNTNMEPSEVHGKREFYVPIGTTNLALHKPVTGSCLTTAGNLALVTDGDKTGDNGSWLELEPGKQWVQIDLQYPVEIYAILVWHFHHHPRVYGSVVVAVCDDSEFKKDVKVVFNNDTENAIGFGKGTNFNYVDNFMGKLIDTKGVRARYVRLYSNGNNENKFNHYVEVEVHGIRANNL